MLKAIYVVHSPALTERRAALAHALGSLGWRAEWVEQPDRIGIRAWLRHRPHPRLNRTQISVFLKHLEVFHRVLVSRAPVALVLEDDAIFPPGFRSAFNRYLESPPADFDFVFFGASCGLEVKPDGGNPLFGPAERARSMSGYLVTARGCAIAAAELRARPFRKPIDLALDEVIRRGRLRAYWSVPAIIENGSENGRFPSSIKGGAWRGAVRRLITWG